MCMFFLPDSGLVLKSIYFFKEWEKHQEVTLEQLQVFKVCCVFAFLVLDTFHMLDKITFVTNGLLMLDLLLFPQNQSPITAMTLSKKKVCLL